MEKEAKSWNTKGELIEFKTCDGLLLHGFLSSVESDTCIIYVHGMTSNFYREKIIKEMSERFTDNGYSFFSMNTRGRDELATFYNVKKERRTIGTRKEIFEECKEDLKGGFKLLKEKGYDNFILIGHSSGCQKITYYQYERKDSRVKALVLLAPVDDYNIFRNKESYKKAIETAKKMVEKNREDETEGEIPWGFTAKRFLSVASLKNIESRLFNYDGDMKEFSSIKIPIYTIFGSEEEYALKPIEKYLEILNQKTSSSLFKSSIIEDTGHSLKGKEEKLAEEIIQWINKL